MACGDGAFGRKHAGEALQLRSPGTEQRYWEVGPPDFWKVGLDLLTSIAEPYSSCDSAVGTALERVRLDHYVHAWERALELSWHERVDSG
jgi:hypothetical protein